MFGPDRYYFSWYKVLLNRRIGKMKIIRRN